MKKKLNIYFLLLTIGILLSCKKDEEMKPPVINFKSGATYTQNDDIVAIGNPLRFGIQATGVSESITNFTIKKELEDGTVITVMDTALFSMSLDIDKTFYQNVEPLVIWKFSVMDRNRMSAEISMHVNKDPNSTFGGIYYYPSITMGFQNNNDYGHFLDPSTGLVYETDSATIYQDLIDILTYYKNDENPSCPVLSSAGEMDNYSTDAKTFYPIIETWNNRNYTLWDISVDDDPISFDAFDNAHNDSLLIVSYDPVWGKKKFKWATDGKVIPFLTAGGKLGLAKIIHADDSDAGEIEMSIKIQQ